MALPNPVGKMQSAFGISATEGIRREPSSHGGFIASIEGLRALAVVVVLLFHLDVPGFQGGYLGVDLFFVISGFIITRNILSDLDHGKFSRRNFYRRRFRRLFPALLVTILLTLLVAVVILPPVELANTARSAVFALLSLANVNFWLEAGYFDAAADAKPFLHTWSPSVEEQFYLLWPALLLALANTRRRMYVALVLLAVSAVPTLLWRNDIPSSIFYLLPFRLHQLMAGALIAILSLNLKNAVGNFFVLAGTAAFIAAAILIDSDFSPAIGAVVVSCCGFLLVLGRDTALAQTLYANKLMQWIGRRSYAIYLVHWPIIVLFKFQDGFKLDDTSRILLLSLSIAAAVVLYELIEKPFRVRDETGSLLQRFAMPAAQITLVGTMVLATVLWSEQGFPSRIDPRIQTIVAGVEKATGERRRAIRFGQCNLHSQHKFSDYDVQSCTLVDPSRSNVLIIGDSMAADTYMMLSQVYPEIHFSQATAGGCTAVLDLSEIGGKYASCEKLNAYRFNELMNSEFDLIVLASIWNEDRIEPLANTVRYLRSKGKKVLVIGPRAHFRGSVPLQISKRPTLDGVNAALTLSVDRETELLHAMRAAMPDVDIVDISAMQCEPECEVIEDERLFYIDERHFTKWGAKRIGDRFRASSDLLAYIESTASLKTQQLQGQVGRIGFGHAN